MGVYRLPEAHEDSARSAKLALQFYIRNPGYVARYIYFTELIYIHFKL